MPAPQRSASESHIVPAVAESLFTRRDLLLLCYLPATAAVAWCMPERYWAPLSLRLSRISTRLLRGRGEWRRRNSMRLLGSRLSGDQCERLVIRQQACHHHARLQLLRCYRPGGWRPRIEISGREHVDRALATGQGGILWVMPFAFSDLVTKMAFCQAGLSVTHLSRITHGFSTSRFGVRILNTIQTSMERRYLVRRLVLSPGQSAAALRELIRDVRDNRLVSITVSSQGSRTYTVPLLDDTMRVADGAITLARRTGAALLPVHTVRTQQDMFLTTIGAPLAVAQSSDRDDAVTGVLTQLAVLMERCILRWPDQYAGWDL